MIKEREKVEVKDFEITLLNGEVAKIRDSKDFKALKSSEYNFYFNKNTGFFVRWGGQKNNKEVPKRITKQELDLYMTWTAIWKEKFDIKEFVADLQTDGNQRVMLPEIGDVEISTLCFGPKINGVETPCSFCYKSNNKRGSYMSSDDFKKVIDTMGPSLTQCALGIGNVDQPNLFEMMDYLIEKDIVPNVTINGSRLSKEILDGLSERCGAISVSYYDKDSCFDAI